MLQKRFVSSFKKIDDNADIGTGNLGGLGVGILKEKENNPKLEQQPLILSAQDFKTYSILL